MKKLIMLLFVIGLCGTWAFAASDSNTTVTDTAKTQNADQAKPKVSKKKSKKSTTTKKSVKDEDTKEVTAK